MKRIKNFLKSGGELIKDQDAFGTPVTVNYKGSDTHKSIFGGVITLVAAAVLLTYLVTGIQRMVARENPDIVSYFLPASRGPEDALAIPDLRGQMYIGLKQRY